MDWMKEEKRRKEKKRKEKKRKEKREWNGVRGLDRKKKEPTSSYIR